MPLKVLSTQGLWLTFLLRQKLTAHPVCFFPQRKTMIGLHINITDNTDPWPFSLALSYHVSFCNQIRWSFVFLCILSQIRFYYSLQTFAVICNGRTLMNVGY